MNEIYLFGFNFSPKIKNPVFFKKNLVSFLHYIEKFCYFCVVKILF